MALVTANEVKLHQQQQKEASVKIKKRRTINSSFSKKNHLNVSSRSLLYQEALINFSIV